MEREGDEPGGRVAPPGPRLHDDADRSRLQSGPTPRSIAAFGVDESRLDRFPGGQGQVWTDGRVVLKSVGFEPERVWLCEVYAAWTAHDVVRVPEPVPARRTPSRADPTWVVDGWSAHVLVPGRDAELLGELDQVREASDLFHGCVAGLERPDWLDVRDDPWAYGDRLAWEGATPIGTPPILALMDRLAAALEPVSSPSQAVHGDVLPNVLLADGRPPAVIDWPLYYRPAEFANAIAITDAVTFRGAAPELLDEWAVGPDWRQLLIRALLYRLGPTGFIATRNMLMGSLLTHAERVVPVIDAVLDPAG
jgi:uncharacterized protein (TIGR02569 family)